MVILIGGVGCTGKTAMAQRLLEKYNFPYLSIDHLKMGLFRGDPGCSFTPEDDSVYIAGLLWPVIKGIIMTVIENKQNLIIEGCYLLPNNILEFDEEYAKYIISFFIGFSKNYIENNYSSCIVKHCNVIELRDDDSVDPAEKLISEHTAQKELCAAYNADYFEINGDYSTEIEKILKRIDIQIRRLKDLQK